MNAWLVTWEWSTPHAGVVDRIAAVIDRRCGRRTVVDFVERLYALRTSDVGQLLTNAKHRRYVPWRVTEGTKINGVPHGARIFCGHNPHLYGRRVTSLSVTRDPDSCLETITWLEPPTFKYRGTGPSVEPVGPLQEGTTTRIIAGPLSSALVWDRAADQVKERYQRCWGSSV